MDAVLAELHNVVRAANLFESATKVLKQSPRLQGGAWPVTLASVAHEPIVAPAICRHQPAVVCTTAKMSAVSKDAVFLCPGSAGADSAVPRAFLPAVREQSSAIKAYKKMKQSKSFTFRIFGTFRMLRTFRLFGTSRISVFRGTFRLFMFLGIFRLLVIF